VLKWIIDRLENKAKGHDTMFGIAPSYSEINWTGLNFSARQFDTVTSIDKGAWVKELELHSALFKQLAHNLPQELLEVKAQIEKRLAA